MSDKNSVRGSASTPARSNGRYAIEAQDLCVFYGDFMAIRDVNLQIEAQKITAIIGPSGCGKSTMLRSFNRMNELVPSARTEGEVLFHGQNVYAQDVDPVQVRRYIGMVFQKPNPFPKSIYENVAWGARINGFRGDMDTLVLNPDFQSSSAKRSANADWTAHRGVVLKSAPVLVLYHQISLLEAFAHIANAHIGWTYDIVFDGDSLIGHFYRVMYHWSAGFHSLNRVKYMG